MKIALAILLLVSGIIAFVTGFKSKALHDATPNEKFEIDKKMIKPLPNFMKIVNWIKYKLMKKYPKLLDRLHVQREAYRCNRKFCREFGEGSHGIGLCSPLACACDKHLNPKEKLCEEELKFDPINGICNYKDKVVFCNLD